MCRATTDNASSELQRWAIAGGISVYVRMLRLGAATRGSKPLPSTKVTMSSNSEMLRTAKESVLFGTPVSADRIVKAEEVLQCKVPQALREFLAEFGWAMIGSWEINGLSSHDDDRQRADLVSESTYVSSLRESPLVCLCDDGGECVFALPVRDGIAHDVIEVWDVHSRETLDGWPSGLSFGAFIQDICRRAGQSRAAS